MRGPVLSLVRALCVAMVFTAGSAGAASAAVAFVTNSSDSGPGSFRAAIIQANTNPAITHVRILWSVNTIVLESTVTFTGPQDLTIDGNGATLDGANAGGPAFVHLNGGGDFTVLSLTVRRAPGEGISYQVPGNATGTIRIVLFNVTIEDNGSHGVLINDQVDSSTPEPPVQPPNAGSDASLDVTVIGSKFINNGNDPDHSVSDNDGLRVNEGGLGDIIFAVRLTTSKGNGADGFELDERSFGDVRVDMLLSTLEENGEFDPADLDDGFDIDEWDEGSVIGNIVSSTAIDNFEEGFDFNENNAGDLRVDFQHVVVNGNREEGIDLEEDDDIAGGGDLVTSLQHIQVNGNGVDGGDGGLKIREKGTGNLTTTVKLAETSNNFVNGIHIREDAVGNLVASISQAVSTENGVDDDGDGIVFDERSDGDLTASVTQSSASNNHDDGVQIDEAGTGAGTAVLKKVSTTGNGDDAVSGNVTPTIVP